MAKRRKPMSRSVYRGLRAMRGYVNAGIESAEHPQNEQGLPDALAAQAWLDDYLEAWAPIYDGEVQS